MKLQLASVDFDENVITLKVPIAIRMPDGTMRKLHYHPCYVEVDLSEFIDEHKDTP
jgi:oxalate decarboxylase/phosphoglucose isomerase-like protein (cupin superfamily)